MHLNRPDRNTGEYILFLQVTFFVCFQEAIESSYCYRIYLTEIYKEFESDTFFPTFDKNTYRLLRYSILRCSCSLQGVCVKIFLSLKRNGSSHSAYHQRKLFRCTLVDCDDSRDLPWLDSPCKIPKLSGTLVKLAPKTLYLLFSLVLSQENCSAMANRPKG